MKYLILITLLMVNCFAQMDHTEITDDPVVILEISTSVDTARKLEGSIRGGSSIYMKVTGLDQNPSNNKVKIGPHDCLIADKGVSGLQLSCETADIKDSSLTWGQPIEVWVSGKRVSSCKASECRFFYQKTPQLSYVYPRSVYPTMNVTYRGFFITTIKDEIKPIMIGDSICDRFADEKVDDGNNMYIWDASIQCQVSADQVPGFYQTKLKTLDGWSKNMLTVPSVRVDTGEIYDVKSLPFIRSLSTNQISTRGGKLQIQGNGFGFNASAAQVTYLGQQAKIISLDQRNIEVELPPLNNNDFSSGQSKFLGGAGFKYTRYNRKGKEMDSCAIFRDNIRAQKIDPSQIAENGFRTEPDIGDLYGENYGTYLRGYFKAPRTGNYKFYTSADDCSEMWFSKVGKSTFNYTTDMELLTINTDHTSYRGYYQSYYQNIEKPINSISREVKLTQGELYYMEVFQVNYGGEGHVTVSVEVPSTQMQYNSIPQIQKVNISHAGKRERIQINYYNKDNNSIPEGNWQLQFRKKAEGSTSYLIDKNCMSIWSNDVSLTTLQMSANWCGWPVLVQRKSLDRNGNLLPDPETAVAGFQITLTYTSFRGVANGVVPTFLPGFRAKVNVTFNVTGLQEGDIPITGGSFRLLVGLDILKVNLNNKWVDLIPYDISGQNIVDALNQLYPKCESRVWSQNNPQDGRVFFISCAGVVQHLPLISVLSHTLTSGSNSASVVASISSSLNYNQLFQPIPSDIIFTGESDPQLQLSISGIQGVCLQDQCDLSPTVLVPDVTSYTLSSNRLTITYSNPVVAFDQFEVNITYAGSNCADVALITSKIVCVLPTLNSKPILFAGSYVPLVNLRRVGYMTVSAAPTSFALTVTSASPTSGSIMGGTVVTIVGTGFPQAREQVQVLVGLVPAKILSINNQQIVIETPAQIGASNNGIVVQFNGLSAQTAYTYDISKTLTVTSIDSTILSPYTKKNLIINGTNFGTVAADISVFLIGKEMPYNQYPLKVNTISDTSLNVRISGGRTAQYNLVVFRKGWGRSKPTNDATDDVELAIKIFRVNNNQLSLGGGTIITIEGQNFDTGDSNTLVFIGSITNWMCDVVDITESQIRCKSPPIHSSFTVGQPQTVNVITRLQDYALLKCASVIDCQVTYQQSMTPVLNVPATARILADDITPKHELHNHRFLFSEETKVKGPNHLVNFFHPLRNLQAIDSVLPTPTTQIVMSPGDVYNLTGRGFGANPIVHLGSNQVSTFLENNDTFISVRLPTQVRAGRHLFRVEVPGRGFSDKAWTAFVYLNIWGNSPGTLSFGGSHITFQGKGMDVSDPKYPIQAELFGRFGPSNTEVSQGKVNCFQIWEIWGQQRLRCHTPAVRNQTGNSYIIRFNQIDRSNLKPETSARGIGLTLTGVPIVDTISGDITGKGDLQFPYMATSPTFQLTINGQNFVPNVTKTWVSFINVNGREIANATITSITNTTIVAQFNNVPAGINTLRVSSIYNRDNDYHFAYFNNAYAATIVVPVNNPTAVTQVISSFLGGPQLQIQGAGFSQVASENEVTVCGVPCPVTQSTTSTLSCTVPPFFTENTMTAYRLQKHQRLIDRSSFDITTDKIIDGNLVVDKLQTTAYQSDKQVCFINFNFGDNRLKLHQLRYFPKIENFVPTKLIGAKFQVSYDGFNYVDAFTINSLVHTGWNFFLPDLPLTGIQSLRFIDTTGSSQCQMAEIQIYGWIQFFQNPPLPDGKICSAKVKVLGSVANVINAVQYAQGATPLVFDVVPPFGPTNGGTKLTITGSGFAQPAQVLVDGIACAIKSLSATQIVCVTGDRQASDSMEQSFVVSINGNQAAAAKTFYYANRFSAEATWGGDIPPREGDSIVVPMGQTLLIDQSPPKLQALIVEGNLLFDDTVDLKLDASYIIIREGRFSIGSEEAPRQKRLEITLHGKIFDKQLPEFGNKVIACHNCKLDIHGQPRAVVWTELAITAEKGAKSIVLIGAVDWRVGEEIVIASTGWNHLETERRIISAISTDKKTISFVQPLQYRHYSAVERYGDTDFPMRAEVGLLTRNVVIQGDPDSWKEEYGAHMMLHGMMSGGVRGRIRFAEFRDVGQPKIIGRYPIHFHMNGEMTDSYVYGNSIHDSFARCVTIHGTHYLRVENNVGFNAKGHGIFMEDGVETNNFIIGNLILGSRQSWIMLQKDITVSTYWITNPYNTVRDNRSGGSEWYGFWYEIKEHPDGPSATSDICPQGIELKEFKNNIAHSNGRFGLRVFQMAPRKFPCQPVANSNLEVGQFDENPAIWSTFENFVTFQNNEDGVLAEEIGNLRFKNMSVADSKLAGFQSHKSNLTRDGAVVENFLIVGKSRGNANPDTFYNGARALIAPRTDGMVFKDVKIYNFGKNMTLLQSCSLCYTKKLWVTGGKNTFFRNIQVFDSTNHSKIYWEKHRREIFFDSDGSIAGYPSYITPFKPHLKNIQDCTEQPSQEWDNSIICSAANLQVRDILVNNPTPFDSFQGAVMKVTRVGADVNDRTEEVMVIIKASKDTPYSFATPFVTGYTYNIHFNRGIDFEHIAFQPSKQFTPSDKGVVLRFNYTAARESFVVGRLFNRNLTARYTNVGQPPDANSCQNGDWWNDKTNRFFYICFSGKNKLPYEYVDVNPVRCEGSACVDGLFDIPKEPFQRLWSNASQWPLGAQPLAGHKVVIPPNWDLILDESTPVLDELVVNGLLTFHPGKTGLNLQAKKIWVRGGKILIGSATQPYVNNAQITLHGDRQDPALLVDEFLDASSKVLAVTHAIEIFGVVPGTTWTRLAAYADKGATSLTVLESNGWKVGDEIAVGPSSNNPNQHEKFRITRIDGNNIQLDRPTQFDHYGDPSVTITSHAGQLDMRAVVMHLTRNIKIQGDRESSGWGCRVLIAQYYDVTLKAIRRGYTNLRGVEFDNCGQVDTDRAGLDFYFLKEQKARRQSNVVGCSFHDSDGMLLSSRQSTDVSVTDSVFYNGQRSLVTMFEGQNNKFKRNALIFVKPRFVTIQMGIPNWAMLGNFATGRAYWHINDIEVADNVGQGSQDTGFAFMTALCNDVANNGFYNNTASSVQKAAFIYRQSSPDCNVIKNVKAFHSGRGIMATINVNEVRVEDIVLAENSISLVIKPGSDNDYTNAYLQKNWFISGLARPSCVKCYAGAQASVCKNRIGYLMGSISSTAFPPPLTKDSDGIDVICTIQKIDGRVYMNNITFDNFKKTYPGLTGCGNNVAMKPHHGAVDMSAAHYTTNTRCTNCDQTQLFYFPNPDQKLRGWFGGCGSFDCTGPLNVYVHDQDGTLLGQPSVTISNNAYFANAHPECVGQAAWNGFHCKTEQIGVLNWMSIAPDYNARLFSPVYLKRNGTILNMVNSLKEWNWDGPEPMNTRESKFTALTPLNNYVDMENAGMNPSDYHFWLNKRYYGGKANDFVIIRLRYVTPQSIQVLKTEGIKEQIVPPFPVKYETVNGVRTPIVQNLLLKSNLCGANNYIVEYNIIEFVVTGASNCLVRVRQVNNVVFTPHLTLDYDSFLANDKFGSFVSKVAAFLDLDPARVKVVGVARGSVIAKVVFEQNSAIGEANTPTGFYDPKIAANVNQNIMNKISYDPKGLSSAIEDIRDDKDPKLTMVIEQLYTNVANNTKYESTEKKNTRLLQEFVVVPVQEPLSFGVTEILGATVALGLVAFLAKKLIHRVKN